MYIVKAVVDTNFHHCLIYRGVLTRGEWKPEIKKVYVQKPVSLLYLFLDSIHFKHFSQIDIISMTIFGLKNVDMYTF